MKALLLEMLLAISTLACGQHVETSSSKVDFKISNLGGVNKVKGEITGMTGKINLNQGEISVCIRPATISTGIKKRDDHLKAPDFFDVERYREICFESTDLEKNSEGYLAKGKLTLHGKTKNVEIPLVVSEENDQTVIKGSFEVNRFDYDLGAESYKGNFSVGKTAVVKIYCVVK